MADVERRIPVLWSGQVAWRRYQYGKEITEFKRRKERLAAQLDDLLIVLGGAAVASDLSELQEGCELVARAHQEIASSQEAGAEQQALVQRRGHEAEAAAAAAQEEVRELVARRATLSASLRELDVKTQQYAGRQDSEAAQWRVRAEGERARIGGEVSRLDPQIVEAQRKSDAAAAAVRSLLADWHGAGKAGQDAAARASGEERDALIRLGRTAAVVAPHLDPELVRRAGEKHKEITAIDGSVHALEEQRAALPTDVSLSADLVAAGLTLLGMLGWLVALADWNASLLWAPAIAVAAVWAIPGNRWWWAPLRMLGSTAMFFCGLVVLIGSFSNLSLPVGALLAQAFLILVVVGVGVGTWRWSARPSRAFAAAIILLLFGSMAHVVLSYGVRLGMREVERAERWEMIGGIRANPAPVIADLRQAVTDGEVVAANRELSLLEQALDQGDARLVDSRQRVEQLEARQRAARLARDRRQAATQARREAQFDRCVSRCQAPLLDCLRWYNFAQCSHLPSTIRCGNLCLRTPHR